MCLLLTAYPMDHKCTKLYMAATPSFQDNDYFQRKLEEKIMIKLWSYLWICNIKKDGGREENQSKRNKISITV